MLTKTTGTLTIVNEKLRKYLPFMLLAVYTIHCDGGVLPVNEFQCEQAVVRLEDCCNKRFSQSCRMVQIGTTVEQITDCRREKPVYDYQDFSENVATCLIKKTCDEIRSAGLCNVLSFTDAYLCASSDFSQEAPSKEACVALNLLGCPPNVPL